jgi:hypothetical protein
MGERRQLDEERTKHEPLQERNTEANELNQGCESGAGNSLLYQVRMLSPG